MGTAKYITKNKYKLAANNKKEQPEHTRTKPDYSPTMIYMKERPLANIIIFNNRSRR
jgi:hypothetical protein